MKLNRSLHKVSAFKAIPSLSVLAIPCFGSKEEVLFECFGNRRTRDCMKQ